MEEPMIAYVVDYCVKKGLPGEGKKEKHPRVLMKKERLIKLLQDTVGYNVNSATQVITEQFRVNWEPEEYEDQLNE